MKKMHLNEKYSIGIIIWFNEFCVADVIQRPFWNFTTAMKLNITNANNVLY